MSAFRISGSHCKLARLRRGLLTSTSRLALGTFVAAGIAMPASATNFSVANSSQLTTAINTAAAGDTITFTQTIALGQNLPELTKGVTINGAGARGRVPMRV